MKQSLLTILQPSQPSVRQTSFGEGQKCVMACIIKFFIVNLCGAGLSTVAGANEDSGFITLV